ncbi:MAG: VWA domain-containing protein [Vicinamibacterales bacterium]
MRRRFGLVGAWLLGAVVTSWTVQATQVPPQTPPPQTPQRPVFTTRIDTVSVDVIVTDKDGRPVTDLTKADFQIQENKKPQTIESLKLIRIDDTQDVDPAKNREIRSLDDQARETARDDVRVMVVFLDDYHTRLGNSMVVREKLSRFVRGLNPRDLVAIMTPLLSTAGVTFSRNHDATARQIMAFQGRKFDYTSKHPAEEVYRYMQPQQIEMLRNQIVTSALEGLCVYLGTLREGRKTIVYVSEGLTTSIPPGARTSGLMPGQGTPTQQPPTGLAAQMEAQRAVQSQQVILMDYLRFIFAAASRSNTSIYTLDPRGLAASEFDIADTVSLEDDRRALNESTDVLRTLASNTEGRAMVGSNDPLPGLQQMLRDSSAYYLLGYTSTEAPRDGKFHPIKVTVTRKGVQVRGRSGYWAYSDEDVARASAPSFTRPPEVEKAFDMIAEPAAGRIIRSWFAGARRPDGRTDVTLVWEALRPNGPEVPARVSVTATAGGQVVHRGRVLKSADATGRVAGQVTFAAPPGPLSVRLAAESEAGDALDTDSREWIVPDFSGVEPTISTPRLHRARTARDIQTLKAAATLVPETNRTFSRIERLLVRFEVHAPAASAPVLRLLNRNGDKISEWPVTSRAGGGHEAEMPLSGVPPGDYLIEIASSTEPGAAKSLVAFRLTG